MQPDGGMTAVDGVDLHLVHALCVRNVLRALLRRSGASSSAMPLPELCPMPSCPLWLSCVPSLAGGMTVITFEPGSSNETGQGDVRDIVVTRAALAHVLPLDTESGSAPQTREQFKCGKYCVLRSKRRKVTFLLPHISPALSHWSIAIVELLAADAPL